MKPEQGKRRMGRIHEYKIGDRQRGTTDDERERDLEFFFSREREGSGVTVLRTPVSGQAEGGPGDGPLHGDRVAVRVRSGSQRYGADGDTDVGGRARPGCGGSRGHRGTRSDGLQGVDRVHVGVLGGQGQGSAVAGGRRGRGRWRCS